MTAYFLFFLQSLLFGAQVGVTYWQPTPITVGITAFVGSLTVHTLVTTTTIRSGA